VLLALLLRPRRGSASALHLAELATLLVFGLLSRDEEWPFLVASLVLTAHLGKLLFARREDASGESSTLGLAQGTPEGSPLAHLLLLCVLFCAGWLQRVGIQGGMHFLHLDWGAGTFRQLEVGTWRIGIAIGLKHLLARALLLGTLARLLPAPARALLWRGSLLMDLTRIFACTAMLYVARDSFWTPRWVIADLPHALMAAVLSALGLWVESRVLGAARPFPALRAAATVHTM
jgi:hypothetical protein